MKDVMKNLLLCATLLTVSGCGDDAVETYTWGDVSIELSVAFCSALEVCSGREVDQPVCLEHTRFHLCETGHTCDVELEEGAEAASAMCVEGLARLDPAGLECYLLSTWGAPPHDCDKIWTFEPDSIPPD